MNYEQAKRLICEKLKSEIDYLDGLNRYKMVLMLRTGIEVKTKGGRIRRTYPIGINLKWLIAHLEGKESPYESIRFTGIHLNDLVALAEFDSVAWDAARELVDKFHEQRDQLPEQLHSFLRFNQIKPKKRGLHRAKNLHRDQCIAACFYQLKECNFFPLTKSSSDSTPNSACHVICKSLSQVNIFISYEGVKSIWNNYKEFCYPMQSDS